MNKMINEIKEIHANAVCLFKVGTFYHAYGRDACIFGDTVKKFVRLKQNFT